MPRIVLSGPAHAYAKSPRAKKPITDRNTLLRFHGLATEEACADLFDEPPLSEFKLEGGRLRIVYNEQRSSLRITTAYQVPRRLKKDEMLALVEATQAQWSDGMGNGSFENWYGEVLSTSLAMAILNTEPGRSDLGEYFVDVCPLWTDEEPAVEISDSENDDDEDLRSLQEAAALGDAQAQFVLGRRLQDGDGIEQNERLAFENYCKASDQGNFDALVFVGLCHDRGTGTTQDLQKALRCFKVAAQKGVPLGMHCLGSAYMEGRGVTQDAGKGIQWYRRGVELGDVGCMAELAECCELGTGMPSDLEQARSLYQRCMDEGFDAVKPALTRVKKKLKRKPGV